MSLVLRRLDHMLKRAFIAAGSAALLALSVTAPASAAAGWTRQPVPLPAGKGYGELDGLSCATASDCAAVGWTGTPRHAKPLAERWDGSTWSVTRVPLPPGGSSAELQSVSCATAARCLAVGLAGVGTQDVPLVERWNGRSWSVQQLPVVSHAFGDLTGVSCAYPAACTAVGGYSPGGSTDKPLVERWNGHTWTRQTLPAGTGDPVAVSCPSATSCAAVTESGAVQWDGTSWSSTTVVAPSHGRQVLLNALSCRSPANCTAVGSYVKGNDFEGLAEHWDGSAWTAQPILSPAGQIYGLSSVSCASATSCTASGYYTKIQGYPLVEVWNGRTWRMQATASPSTSKGFNAVACVTAHVCSAVGYQKPTPGFTALLAEQEQ